MFDAPQPTRLPAPGGIAVFDTAGIAIAIDTAAAESVGRLPRDLLGRRLEALRSEHPGLAELYQHCCRARERGEAMHYRPHALETPTIEDVHIIPEGEQLYVYWSVTRPSNAELIAENAKLRGFLDALPDLFFQLDGEGAIADCEAGSDSRHYVPRELLLGVPMQELLPVAARPKFAEAFAAARDRGTPSKFEYLAPLATREECYEARLLPCPAGRFLFIVRNISDLHAAQQQLRQQTEELQQTLRDLQRTQSRLVQTEKMSSLRQLVAGVAHEINNPANFIHGNLVHARKYAAQLLDLVAQYQQRCPKPDAVSAEQLEALDWDFLAEDFPRLLNSMQVGSQRIREIVSLLRSFSRLDEEGVKDADLHAGIEQTLTILHYRLKPKPDCPGIAIVRQYGDLPLVECNPGQLNQVFMNVLANAIDALQERDRQRSAADLAANPSQIVITSERLSGDRVCIRIRDNGPGIPAAVQARIFDPFFTTKPVGQGTGLGMSIAHQVTVEAHCGWISFSTAPEWGTEFAIELPIRQAIAAKPPASEPSD